MRNENTKYKNKFNLLAIVIASILSLIIIAVLIYLLAYVDKQQVGTKGVFQSEIFKMMLLFVIRFLLAFMLASLIGSIFGLTKGKVNVLRENKNIKKTNPYIYYRELPNNFGIGVATLLIDSKIENHKDIVAVILDLCARKYLKLIKVNDKYIIKIIKTDDGGLLNNEKYILNLLINDNIKNIDYQEWYNYCMQDGVNLGLYYHIEVPLNTKPLLTEDPTKKTRVLRLIISLILSVGVFIICFIKIKSVSAIFCAVFAFIVIYIIIFIPVYICGIFKVILTVGKQASMNNYQNEMNNKLTKTKKGIDELHKLYSFKFFINDFGNFVDKNAESVILWDRYLSYAQVFGLTKNIMNTGYKQLIDNSSFQIDSIDNITLSDLKIE